MHGLMWMSMSSPKCPCTVRVLIEHMHKMSKVGDCAPHVPYTVCCHPIVTLGWRTRETAVLLTKLQYTVCWRMVKCLLGVEETEQSLHYTHIYFMGENMKRTSDLFPYSQHTDFLTSTLANFFLTPCPYTPTCSTQNHVRRSCFLVLAGPEGR